MHVDILTPVTFFFQQGTDQWFSIDNELFELMPIEVELLKNKMHIFVPDKTFQIKASS